VLQSNILTKTPKGGRSKDGLLRIGPLPKKLFFFFLFLFTLFTLGGAFHHHADGCEQDGCLLCRLASQDSAYSISMVPSAAPVFFYFLINFTEGSFALPLIVQNPFLPRAPPIFALSL
jgi:hypothetical protein